MSFHYFLRYNNGHLTLLRKRIIYIINGRPLQFAWFLNAIIQVHIVDEILFCGKCQNSNNN